MSKTCLDSAPRSDGVFCAPAPIARAAFDGIDSPEAYVKGTVLFREGQSARKVYHLCEGRVRLSVCSENGRRLTFRVALPGEVLGLSAALTGARHEVTAEALDNVRVAAVGLKDLAAVPARASRSVPAGRQSA